MTSETNNQLHLSKTAVGSIVKISTIRNGTFEGEVVSFNPKLKCNENYIILLNPLHTTTTAKNDDTDNEVSRTIVGSYIIFQHEVKTVILLKTSKKLPKSPPEQKMDTVIIENFNQLNIMYKLLENVKEIGCSIEEIVGYRFTNPDSVKYILLNVNNLITVLSLTELVGGGHIHRSQRKKNEKQLWEGLGGKIFSNPKIVKIFFDSRSVSDYLHHVHTITLVNVFDLRITEQHLRISAVNKTSNHQKKKLENIAAVDKIEDLWSTYLSDYVPLYETLIMNVERMKKAKDFSKYLPKRRALKVKHLLALKMEMEKALIRPHEISLDQRNRRYCETKDIGQLFSTSEEWDE